MLLIDMFMESIMVYSLVLFFYGLNGVPSSVSHGLEFIVNNYACSGHWLIEVTKTRGTRQSNVIISKRRKKAKFY